MKSFTVSSVMEFPTIESGGVVSGGVEATAMLAPSENTIETIRSKRRNVLTSPSFHFLGQIPQSAGRTTM
jgi:hypothetical protein